MLSTCQKLVCLLLAACPLWAASYYTTRLDDPKAVYLTAPDPVADSSEALQQAIDRVQATTRQGIVFVPEGRYRLTRTINVWPAVRLIGYGARRPVFLLPENTPGFSDPAKENFLLFFAGARPGDGRTPAGAKPPEANPGTFYSAISNIDIEVQSGNAGAVAIRARYAQHCYLAHMDIEMGSGLAAVHEGGNVIEDVRFRGGRVGVWSGTPSPGWQFTLVDVVFEAQKETAIRSRAASLTLIRPHFRGLPTAVEVEPDSSEALWMKDGRMEDLSGPALVISRERAAKTQINLEGVTCRNVAQFALLRESGRKLAGPAPIYQVKTFSHGLHLADSRALPETQTHLDAAPLSAMPAPVPSDLFDLPARDSWVNVRTLGAKGDGRSDDTEALRKAIAAQRALYFPSGNYVISDTLTLRPDSVLIGLHPSTTQIDLVDGTPGFQGIGNPKPMIEAPQGGTNIMIGLGVYSNGINPRAVAVKWMAGTRSLMNDVRLLGGHGTNKIDGSRENPYNNTHTADPDLNRRWDGQYASLWVTDGGGGTFFDIWTPSTFSQAGMLVSNTTTEGRVYEMSSEHHVRYEMQVHNASNWHIYALQTESERGEGGNSFALEIDASSHITVANFTLYRVISTFQPFPYAVKVTRSDDIRFRNFHCYSNSKTSYDAAVYDASHNAEVRQREFALLTLTAAPPKPRAPFAAVLTAPGAKVQKLAGGFFNISGGAVDAAGDFYFVDAHWQRIHRWLEASRQLVTVRDEPLDPVNLAFTKTGQLMVVSYAGKGIVYSLDPAKPHSEITIVPPVAAAPRPGLTAILPVSDWRLRLDAKEKAAAPRPYQFLSTDGTAFLSAGDDFVNGAVSWGIKSADLIRGFGLAPAVPGKPFYFSDEAEVRSWQFTVGADGSLNDMKLFAEQGGEGSAVDAQGNVYLAAGQIYVYSPAGQLIDAIEVPERPIQIVFGGADRRTLYIAARTSLYSVRTRYPGR